MKRILAAIALLFCAQQALAGIPAVPPIPPVKLYAIQSTRYGLSTAASDNGPAIAAAISAAANGVVQLPCGTFNFTTPIVATRKVVLAGQNQACTQLNYTGTSGTAITFSTSSTGSSGTDNFIGFGLRDLTVHGAGLANSTIGVQVGSTSTSNTMSAPYFTMDRVKVQGFGTGMTWGSGAYITFVRNSMFVNNESHFIYPNGLVNSGESITFTDNLFGDGDSANNFQNCIQILGGIAPLDIKGGSIDDCQVYVHHGYANVNISKVHFETPGLSSRPLPFVNVYSTTGDAGRVTISDADVYQNTVAPTATSMFAVSAVGTNTFLNINNLVVNSGLSSPLPMVVSVGGKANMTETNTKGFYCSAAPCFQNFAVNTGTGSVRINTPSSVMHTAQDATTAPDSATAIANQILADPAPMTGAINLLTYSNTFTNGVWGAFCNAGTTSSTDVPDPTGNANAVGKIVSVSAAAGACNSTQTGITQNTQTVRLAGDARTACVWARSPSGVASQVFYLGSGVTTVSKTATPIWTRYCTSDATDTSKRAIAINLEATGGTTGGNTLYIWGASVNPGTLPTAYAATSASIAYPTTHSEGPVSLYGPTTFGGQTNITTLNVNGYLFSAGSAPFLDITSNAGTSCGATGASNTGATNMRGIITLGSTATTACNMTFAGGNYAGVSGNTAVPVCYVWPIAGGSIPALAVSATGFSLTFGTSQTGTKFGYICEG